MEFGGVNYRMLYFFHGPEVVVVTHGLTKKAEVPAKDIDLAVERRELFESDPERYRYEE